MMENFNKEGLDLVKQTLKQYWGYDTFRGRQEEAIHNILNKKDMFFLAPTSLGKSVVFQLPSLVTKGLTLVISPLLALQADQTNDLNNRRN